MSVGWPTGTLTVTLLAVAAASALGATIRQPPTVSGDPSPGSELTATPGEWTPPGAIAGYDWLRCDASGEDCHPIPGSCDRRYTVRDPDLGHTLRARLTVAEHGQPPATARSEPTAVVVDKPYSIPTGGDIGEACAVVTPTGPGEGTFTSGSPGAGSTPAPDTSLPFIDPFPVVRISGRFTRSLTRLTRVTVRAPGSARIRVDCRGRGCPYRSRAIAVKLVRVRALQRSYRPGATIEIRVMQARRIGKDTRLKRAGARRRCASTAACYRGAPGR